MVQIKKIITIIKLFSLIEINQFLDKYSFIKYYFPKVKSKFNILLVYLLKQNYLSLSSFAVLIFLKKIEIFTLFIFISYLFRVFHVDIESLSYLDRNETKIIRLPIVQYIGAKLAYTNIVKTSIIIEIFYIIIFKKYYLILLWTLSFGIQFISYFYYYFIKKNLYYKLYICLNYIFSILGIIFGSYVLIFIFNNVLSKIFVKDINYLINMWKNMTNYFHMVLNNLFYVYICNIIIYGIIFLLISLGLKNDYSRQKVIIKYKGRNKFLKHIVQNWDFFKFKILNIYLDRSFWWMIFLLLLFKYFKISVSDYQIIIIVIYYIVLDIDNIITNIGLTYINLWNEHKFISLLSEQKISQIYLNKIIEVMKMKYLSFILYLIIPLFFLKNSLIYLIFIPWLIIIIVSYIQIYANTNLVTFKQNYNNINDFFLEKENSGDYSVTWFDIQDKFLFFAFLSMFFLQNKYPWINIIIICISLFISLITLIFTNILKKRIIKNMKNNKNNGSYEKIF